MQYFGGKVRIAAQIADFLSRLIERSDGIYVEPFVGGANVIPRISASRRFAGDANTALITILSYERTGI